VEGGGLDWILSGLLRPVIDYSELGYNLNRILLTPSNS
jgi:hypothetical protein